jgi:hypothetical protein
VVLSAEDGEADLHDVGVVGRELGVARHGGRLGIGQQRLTDGDRDDLGQLGQRRRVRTRQQVAAGPACCSAALGNSLLSNGLPAADSRCC